MRAFMFLVVVMVAQGCATKGVKTYHAPQTVMGVPNQQMLAAAERNARQKGWSILRRDDVQGLLEARSAATIQDGIQTREHWIFTTRDGRMAAQRTLEVCWRGDGNDWDSTPVVANAYEYYRERQELAAISFILDNHQPVPRLPVDTRGLQAMR